MKRYWREDPVFVLVMVGVLTVTAWLLATPVVGWVSMATMRRFHLHSENYVTWAAQFPIPAMYNFANRFRYRRVYGDDVPIESIVPVFDLEGQSVNPPEMTPWRYLNHFPTRVMTFADGRYRYGRTGWPYEFEIESRYGDQLVRSLFRWRRTEEGVYVITRRRGDATDE